MIECGYGKIKTRIARLFHLRVVQIAVVFAGFVALLAAVLPYGLAEGLKLWLHENGARHVSIGDVQFNLFTARFLVRDAHFDTDPNEPVNVATIEGALSHADLLRGRILFDRLLIRNATLAGSQTHSGASWRFGGITLNKSPSAEISSSSESIVGVRVLQIENSTASLALPKGDFDIQIGSARLENLIPWVANETAGLEMAGRIAGASVEVTGNFSPYSRRPSAFINLTAIRLPVSSLALLFNAGGFAPKGLVSLRGEATLKFDDTTLAHARYEGAIDGENLSLNIPDMGTAQVEGFSWEGVLTEAKGGEMSGQLGARGVRLKLAGLPRIVAGEVVANKIRMAVPGSGSFQSFVIRNFEAYSPHTDDNQRRRPADFSADVMRGGPATLLSDRLQMQEILAEGAQLRFVRRGAKLMGPNRLFDRNEVPMKGGESRRLDFHIDRVQFEKGSALHFRDENVVPDFVMDTRLDEFRVENIDNRRPGLATKFTIRGSVDKYTKLEASGHVAPFGASLAAEIQVRAERISLPSLNPYLERETGYAFKSGVGDVKAKVRIDKGELNAGNVVTLRGMEVEPARPDAASAASASLAMPVEAMLSLLRDKNSDIKLEIPVTGNISAPHFNFSDVFAKAASGAMKSASLGFLKYALQPFGAAILAGELARDIDASIRLDPVIFQPGNSKIEPRHTAFVDRIAVIMRERPGLRLKLCGKAVPGDRLALAAQRKQVVTAISDKDLIDLAAARVDVLMRELVQIRGLTSGRMISCQAKIDSGPGAAPRVEFLI